VPTKGLYKLRRDNGLPFEIFAIWKELPVAEEAGTAAISERLYRQITNHLCGQAIACRALMLFRIQCSIKHPVKQANWRYPYRWQ
jgi:hypothetical protein